MKRLTVTFALLIVSLFAFAQDIQQATDKLEVLAWTNPENVEGEYGMIMLGMKTKIKRGQVFGFQLEGEDLAYLRVYDKEDENKISKRSPFVFYMDRTVFTKLKYIDVKYVIVANEWYELTDEHREVIKNDANTYYPSF